MAKTDDDKTMPKGETADDLHTLTAAVKGDLTKLAGPKAEKLIGHWESVLEKVGAKTIHTDLGKLREHVTADEPDGKAIAKLLHSLSTKTAKVAEDTGGVVGTALKSLAGALEKAGASLGEAGADDGDADGKKTKAHADEKKSKADDADDDKSKGGRKPASK